MYLKSSIYIVLCLLMAFTSSAYKPKKYKKKDARVWEKIGEKTVDFVRDRDEIKISAKERFESIKIVVTDAPIYLNNIVITFETGNDQPVSIKEAIKKPGDSKTFKIAEPLREIQKIYFVYSTIPNAMDKKAHLEIYGSKLKSDSKVSSIKEEKETNSGPALVLSDKTGWQSLGTRVLDLKVGRDEITVLGADRFASIKFRLINGCINMADAAFEFESGDGQSVLLNKELVAAMETEPLNLNGGERRLKKIVFNYKSGVGNHDNEAEIEIWGYKSNSEQTNR